MEIAEEEEEKAVLAVEEYGGAMTISIFIGRMRKCQSALLCGGGSRPLLRAGASHEDRGKENSGGYGR